MKKAMFILIGIVIGIVGSCYATYKLQASQVSFDKSKTNLNSNDVQGAIDEIIDNFKVVDEFEGRMILSPFDESYAYNDINVQGYKKITFLNFSNLFTDLISLQTENGTIIENKVTTNKIYDISNYDKVRIVVMVKKKSMSGAASYVLSK